MELLNDYIIQFIEQQRCHRHHAERAKMIKLKHNFKEAFICSQCIEIDHAAQMVTLKRATDSISNFILYDSHKVNNPIAALREKLQQFVDHFNNLLGQLEKQVTDREQLNQQLQRQYSAKVNELERLMRHIQASNSNKQVDVQHQVQLTETLKGSVLLLLQNEELLQQCSKREASRFDQSLSRRVERIENLLQEATSQVQQVAEEKSLMVRRASQSELVSPTQKHLMFSTFTSQLSRSMLNTFTFKAVHPSFKLLSPTKLQIPVATESTKKVRLALIYPRLQEGPLKPPKSITFFISQQIQQNIQIGVCETGSTDLDSAKPHKLFQASKFPYFTRGDQLTLTVNPATGLIQLVKNKAFNSPQQAELNLDCWTNMVFVVASMECAGGGGEVHIVFDE